MRVSSPFNKYRMIFESIKRLFPLIPPFFLQFDRVFVQVDGSAVFLKIDFSPGWFSFTPEFHQGLDFFL